MSSLMVSNLEIMMLEFAVQKLFVPKTSIFDSVIMKKTTVMFRMLDYDWTGLNPHRKDHVPYRGSNLEEEDFHGGKSVVFAIPTESLEKKMNGVDIQIHVRKEVSKYFEMDSCQNVGIALVNVDALFNGIIKELRERKELGEYLSCLHKRQPISRSLKGTYEIIDEDQRITGATITVYVRLSHFGKSIITEIETCRGKRKDFYAQEETNESFPYQCRELKVWQLEGGHWGSETFLPPLESNQLKCYCDVWDSMDDPDDGAISSDDETRRGGQDSLQRLTMDAKRQSAKKMTDGRGESKSDSFRDSKGNTDIPATKRGKKKMADGRASQIEDGSKVKRKTLTGSAKKGGKANNGQRKTVMMERTDYRSRSETAETPAGRGTKVEGNEKTNERSSEFEDGGKVKKKSAAGSGRKERTGARKSSVSKSFHEATPQHDDESKVKKKSVTGAGKKEGKVAGARTSSDVAKTSEKPKIAEESTVNGTRSSNEYKNRRIQLLRRSHGAVTVGFRDKENRICPRALPTSSTLPACPPSLDTSPLIRTTICPDLCPPSSCCYRPIRSCKPTIFSPGSCSFDTRNNRSCYSYGTPGVINVPEMFVLTS